MRLEEWRFKKVKSEVQVLGFVTDALKFPNGSYIHTSAVKSIEFGKEKLLVHTRAGHIYELYFTGIQRIVSQNELVEMAGDFGLTPEIAVEIKQASKKYWKEIEQNLTVGKLVIKMVGYMPTCVLFGEKDMICHCYAEMVGDFTYRYTNSKDKTLTRLKLGTTEFVEVQKITSLVKELELHTVQSKVKGLPAEPEETGVTMYSFKKK